MNTLFPLISDYVSSNSIGLLIASIAVCAVTFLVAGMISDHGSSEKGCGSNCG